MIKEKKVFYIEDNENALWCKTKDVSGNTFGYWSTFDDFNSNDVVKNNFIIMFWLFLAMRISGVKCTLKSRKCFYDTVDKRVLTREDIFQEYYTNLDKGDD